MNLRNRIIEDCISAYKGAGGGRMLLAVSGGADSTALFAAFRMAGLPFEVAHCNFNLRGEESLRDRDFVAGLCAEAEIPLHQAEFDTLSERLEGESVEMACRRLRYDFFYSLMSENGFSRTVLAHNADDNIETLFLNLLRGSGINGLKGMAEDNGRLLRPLLKTSRKEIIAFLEEINRDYIIDSSNLESEYKRNFLRNEVLPLLETRWPGLRRSLTNSIGIFQGEARIVNRAIEKVLSEHKDFLPTAEILSFPDSITLIFRFINPYGGTKVQAREIEGCLREKKIGQRWFLSGAATLALTKSGLRIIMKAGNADPAPEEIFRWERMEKDEIGGFEKSNDVIYLPYPKDRYLWRKPDTKMLIKSLGMRGSQPVWKILKDAGFLPEEREAYPILVDKESGEVIWVPGVKRSRLHLLNGEEEEIFRVSKS